MSRRLKQYSAGLIGVVELLNERFDCVEITVFLVEPGEPELLPNRFVFLNEILVLLAELDGQPHMVEFGPPPFPLADEPPSLLGVVDVLATWEQVPRLLSQAKINCNCSKGHSRNIGRKFNLRYNKPRHCCRGLIATEEFFETTLCCSCSSAE